MPDDELEPRLRRMLAGRASAVTPQLDGAELRARAATGEGRTPKIIAPLLVAAAIVLLALTPTLFNRSDGHPRHTVPPGSVSVTVTVPTRTPSPAPSSTGTTAPTVPTVPTVPVISPTSPVLPVLSSPLAPGSASTAPASVTQPNPTLPSASVPTRLPSSSNATT